MTGSSYKVRDGYPRADCAAAWEGHRRMKLLVLVMFAGWIPFGLTAMLLFHGLHLDSASDWIFPVVFVPYMLALLIVANVAAHFRCPQCGSRFYAWGPFGMGHNGFARKCRNCGLKKWQCNDQSRATSN